MKRKIKAAFAGLLMVGLIGWIAVQSRKITELQKQISVLQKSRLEIPAPSVQEVSKSASGLNRDQYLELMRLRSEVGLLRRENHELKALISGKEKAGTGWPTNWVTWSERRQLTDDQENLAQLLSRLDRANEADPDRSKLEAEVNIARQKLEQKDWVRPAHPFELFMIPGNRDNEILIFNPSDENLVFQVNTKSDVEPGGSRLMAVARQTWLPPGNWLIVPNPGFASPGMRKIEP